MSERIMNNNSEYDTEVTFFELGEVAEGSIEPRTDQQERLEEFTQRVGSGEFHVETDHALPCGCIDGRCGCSLKPNSAGGTETLMVADDLTTKRFASDGTTATAYKAVVEMLHQRGELIGGHDDDHAGDGKSGCGANDKLDLIYAMIGKQSDAIRQLTESLGVAVSDEDHQLIVNNAMARDEFSSGEELLETLKSYGDDKVDHLRGSHNEVVAVINKRSGTTLDRDALEAEFGPNYEAFNVDAWSFEAGAEAISESESEIPAKVAAMVYYNLATSLVLGGKKLRVTVLE